MKILIINPNSDEETVKTIMRKVEKMPIPGVEFDCIRLTHTPKLISTYVDCAMTILDYQAVIDEYDSEVDGYILACFSDPNLDAVREMTKKPVIGIAESAMKLASVYGDRFGIISPTKRSGERKVPMARKYYCDQMLGSIVVPESETPEGMLAAARKLIEDGCQSILLGCGNYVDDDKWMEKELGVPVIDGLACAMFLTAGLARYSTYKNS